MVGRLKRVRNREVWEHEAWNFSAWLENNLDLLEEETGLQLTLDGREVMAGRYRADLLARDEDGNRIVIENQLEWTNHDHLGKVITYLAAFDARTAIWIVSGAQAEHVEAIAWLNQNCEADYYLLKVEAVQIDDSKPAPLFTLIIGPSEEEAPKLSDNELPSLLREFWAGLQDVVNQRTELHKETTIVKDYWLRIQTKVPGVFYYYFADLDKPRVELYLQTNDRERNRTMFDQLKAERLQIESELGGLIRPLTWRSPKNWGISKIEMRASNKGYRHRDNWPEVYEAMVDAMIRFQRAFSPRLERLREVELSADSAPTPKT